jgi:predicted HTH domain antitoxin
MEAITMHLPDLAFEVLGPGHERVESELRLLAAVKMFEMGRLSSGAAAELAGITKSLFLTRLADFGISGCNMTVEDLEEDYYIASSDL